LFPQLGSLRSKAPQGSLLRLARVAIPVGGVNIFGSLVYTIQTPLVGVLLGPDRVPSFYLAQKIALSFNTLVMQIALPKIPYFTRSLGEGKLSSAKRIMFVSIILVSVLSILSAVAFILFSPFLASHLLKKIDYVASGVLVLIALDFATIASTNIWAQFVLASGRNPFVLPTVLAGILNVVFCIFFVPLFGIYGLPLASFCANLFSSHPVNLYYGIGLYKSLRQNLHPK
jgi:O-antigen/teichoic acid export membrane protein